MAQTKEERAAYQREWRIANPESAQRASVKYFEAHPGLRRAAWAKYRDTHREQLRKRWRENAAANREARNKYNAEYRLRNPAKIKEGLRVSRLKHSYGITPEQFEAMKAAQGGCCAICHEPKQLGVDHCHTTGVVRGLLCSNCNTALGLLHDSQTKLDNAKEYLKKYDTNTNRL